MYGTFCNLLMVLEMSRGQAHKSLSPRSQELGTIRSAGGMLFISSVEWDDSCHGEYFYCSVWLHLDRVRYLRWLQLLTSSTYLALHSIAKKVWLWRLSVPFQLSNWPSKQFGTLPEIEPLEDSDQCWTRICIKLTNERSQLEMGPLMFRCNCFKALWNWIGAGKTAASAKYVVCPVQL